MDYPHRSIRHRRAAGLAARLTFVACLLALVAGSLLSGSAGGQVYPLPTAATTAPPPRQPPVRVTPSSLTLLSPFPVVRMAGRPTRRGVKINLLTVKAAAGTYVVSRCVGTAARCPYKQKIVRVNGPARATRTVHIRGFERPFRSGTVLRIYVVNVARIGKFTSFRIRGGGLPRRHDSCVRGPVLSPVRCPVS